MCPTTFSIYIFALIIAVDGLSCRNESNVPRERIQRDKANDFTCGGKDMTTLLSSFINAVWSNTIPKDGNITLYLVEKNLREPIILNVKNKLGGPSGVDALTRFGPTKKTVIITHGFGGSFADEWVKRMVEAYLAYEDVNVVIADWSVLAKTKNYHNAARGTISAGTQIADLLEQIYRSYVNDDLGPIHMIGFSLGAHVVGIAADKFNQKILPWKIPRITGLDPAYPCFQDNQLALDKDDAPLVDIIHTNGNKDEGLSFGTPDPMGDIDFYPNGGEMQPGCSTLKSFIWGIFHTVAGRYARAVCSHSRAVEYFIESLKSAAARDSRELWGGQWDHTYCRGIKLIGLDTCSLDIKCETMGIKADEFGTPGSYYVVTAQNKPYNKIEKSDRAAAFAELQRIFEV